METPKNRQSLDPCDIQTQDLHPISGNRILRKLVLYKCCTRELAACKWCTQELAACKWCTQEQAVCMWCTHVVAVCKWCKCFHNRIHILHNHQSSQLWNRILHSHILPH